jgi:hypothetical protein
MTQSAYSKFELTTSDIVYSNLVTIVENLEVSFEELNYIHNNYQYSKRDLILNKLTATSYNKEEEIMELLTMTNTFLETKNDVLVRDVQNLCKSMLIFVKESDSTELTQSARTVWKRLSKKNQLYIRELYLLNAIFYLFPIEMMSEIKKMAFKSLDRYKDFQNIQRLKINMGLNFSLVLLKEKHYEEALIEIEKTIPFAKYHQTYLQLAVCYVRKGICLECTLSGGKIWIEKGLEVLRVLEEENLVSMLEAEVLKYCTQKNNPL